LGLDDVLMARELLWDPLGFLVVRSNPELLNGNIEVL
jgi:hypothetical protein